MSCAYYKHQLRLYWSECRPNIYEPVVFHGLNCKCLNKVSVTDDDNDKIKRKGTKK